MIVYIDKIEFKSKELAESGFPLKKINDHKLSNIPLGKTYFKVLRGSSTTN